MTNKISKKELTLDKVMAKLANRLRQSSTAVITEEEFECLQDEVTGLIFYQESHINFENNINSDSFETLYGVLKE